jgi:predicted nucleotidyltransferase
VRKNKDIAEQLKKIKSCIGQYKKKIPFAFLFGSLAEGKQTPLSDIDIAIFFRDMRESEKTKIEHQISLLFDEQVNVLRLEDEYISPLIKLEALNGIPVIINDGDLLNRFILSIIHIAEEHKRILNRLRKAA